tara:strand:- start:614 stop:1057 length:444 start_codon:yes stop_codon:yes gene_type:complete
MNSGRNVVEDLLFAVEQLQETEDQTEAIKHMEKELTNLKTILPFVLTAGADVSSIKTLVIELAEQLDIEIVKQSSRNNSNATNQSTITAEEFKEFMNNNCKGSNKAKSKSDIQRSLNCTITSKDLRKWVGEYNISANGNGAGKKYHT